MRASAAFARTRGSGAWSSVQGQAALLGLGYLIRTAGAFALVVLLGRLIGPAGYGRVSVYIAVAWAAFYLPASWVLVSVPALSPQRRGKRVERDVLWGAVAVGVIGVALSCAVVVGALASSERLRETMPSGSAVPLVLSAFGLLALNVVYVVHQAERRAQSVAFLQALERLLSAALVAIALLTFGADERVVTWALAAATLLTAGTSASNAAMRRSFGGPTTNWAAARRSATFSAPLAVSNVCAYLVGWVDVLIIALVLGPSDAGIYSVAYQLFALLAGLTSAWLQAAVPEHAQRTGVAVAPSVGGLVRGAATWSAAVGLFGVVAVVLFSPIFGEEFKRGAPLAAGLLVAASFLAPYYAGAPRLMTDGRSAVVMWASLASAGSNLVLDICLVRSLGLWAGVIGTGVQTVIGVVWVVVVVYNPQALLRLLMALAPVAVGLGALTLDPGALATRLIACALVVLASVRAVRSLLEVRGRR